MGVGSNLVQLAFVTYLAVVGFNLYHLFVPSQCGDGAPRHLCVPPALGRGDRYDLWVYASPKKHFHSIEKMITSPDVNDPELGNATVRLMMSAFALELGGGHEATVKIPAAQFGTRNNGTLYAHVLLYRSSVKKNQAKKEGLAHPKGSPLAVTSASITKMLAYRERNYTMLLGNWTAGMGKPNAADGDTALEGDDVDVDVVVGAGGGGGGGGEVNTKMKMTKTKTTTNDEAEAAAAAGSTCDAEGANEEEGTCKSPPTTTMTTANEDGSDRSSLGATTAADADAAAASSSTTLNYEPHFAYTPLPGQFVTHIRPRIGVMVVGSPPTFPHNNLPADIGFRFVKPSSRLASKGYQHAYRPLIAVDDVSITRREYRMLSADLNRDDPDIIINVKPLNIGLFRLMNQMTQSMTLMTTQFGMTESDLDELKEIFTGTDWKWLALTFGVSILHSWFAFLAFKNDIGFWKKKSNLEGLSVRTQWSSFVCQLIIFLNLADTGQASTIILCEMGVSVVIEGWKVSKFLARNGQLNFLGVGPKPKELTQMQKDTDEYDKRAMRFLSIALYPIVAAYGVYSLIYDPQRSWRSWVLRTLANGVYMFGFIAMTPQLYINYRLKSVAHLPWKAFMYKAFNTFIDDVFAFAIAMPTIHRLACLRDDLVFFVYLYQRWLYPVDKKRVNEFGRAYEEDEEEEEEGEETKGKEVKAAKCIEGVDGGDDGETETKRIKGANEEEEDEEEEEEEEEEEDEDRVDAEDRKKNN